MRVMMKNNGVRDDGGGVDGSPIELVLIPVVGSFVDDNNCEASGAIGVRDYILVVDLTKDHIATIEKFKDNCGLQVQIVEM
ncbi:unnamed protein product [Adineta steineri]|uniref:Uncharacterized protein n=1 Tax=Adineta steineri TaxID=433720 RepID=A0A819MQT7_9BILA|nr:unnamed protein product [Adineta steineri]